MAIFDVRDFGATGNGSTDDTSAIVNCINYAASVAAINKFQAAIRFPSAQYAVSDGTAGANNQQIMKISGAAASLTLHVTMGGGSQQDAVPFSYDPANPTTNASSMQSALQALPVIGTGNVTVTYQPDADWYAFVFAPTLGVPALSGTGSGLTVTVMLGNFNQQALPPLPASRALVWNGAPNGLMLHLPPHADVHSRAPSVQSLRAYRI